MALTTLQRRVLTAWINEQVGGASESGQGDQVQRIRAVILMDEAELVTQIDAHVAVLRQRLLDQLEEIANAQTNVEAQLAALD